MRSLNLGRLMPYERNPRMKTPFEAQVDRRNFVTRYGVGFIAIAAGFMFKPAKPHPPHPHPTTTTTSSTTSTTSSVPSGRAPSNATRTSQLPGSYITRDGVTYKQITGFAFSWTNGGHLDVDETNVLIVNCGFYGASLVANTSGMLQQQTLTPLIVEDCNFDGGPTHERGMQNDRSHTTVRRSTFTKFGNAAIEMNNRDVSADLTIEDCTFTEVPGWKPADHTDAIQFGSGRNMVIRRCTLHVAPTNTDGSPSNSCIGGWAELGNTSSVLIEDCTMSGGGLCMYLEQKSPWLFTGPVIVQRCRFDRTFYPQLNGLPSYWGGVLYKYRIPPQLQWLNNTWEDGSPLSLAGATNYA